MTGTSTQKYFKEGYLSTNQTTLLSYVLLFLVKNGIPLDEKSLRMVLKYSDPDFINVLNIGFNINNKLYNTVINEMEVSGSLVFLRDVDSVVSAYSTNVKQQYPELFV